MPRTKDTDLGSPATLCTATKITVLTGCIARVNAHSKNGLVLLRIQIQVCHALKHLTGSFYI